MKTPEAPTNVYAQPDADSTNPAIRGHITGGWEASEQSLVEWDDNGNGTVRRILRGSNGERVEVEAGQHERIQRIMGELARMYPETMKNSPSIQRDNSSERVASAADQLRDNGIISKVPGAKDRISVVPTESMPTPVVSEPSSIPAEHVASVVEARPTSIASFSEALGVASVLERVNAGTFDPSVLAYGMYRAIDRLLEAGVPRNQETQFMALRKIQSNLSTIGAMGRGARDSNQASSALRQQLRSIESLSA